MPSSFFLFLSGWNWCLDNLLETKTWSVNILATQQTYHYSAASKKKKTKNQKHVQPINFSLVTKWQNVLLE